MLSLLDLINSYLGYFTANTKTKGRIYSVVGFVGVWYLLYLSYRFFENGRLLRSSTLMVVFAILLYFSVLNLIYYFTDRAVSWDVSRNIAKVLGTTATEEPKGAAVIIPANGLYERKDVVKAQVTLDANQKARLEDLALQLTDLGMWSHDYGKLSKSAQRQIIAQRGSIAANHPGTLLPYFGLKTLADGQLVVEAGINQLTAQNVATIKRVGLLPAHQALEEYRLGLASAVITGGKSKARGRKGITEVKQPYRIQVEVAYQQQK